LRACMALSIGSEGADLSAMGGLKLAASNAKVVLAKNGWRCYNVFAQ